MPTLDPSKTYRTRNGLTAKVLTVEAVLSVEPDPRKPQEYYAIVCLRSERQGDTPMWYKLDGTPMDVPDPQHANDLELVEVSPYDHLKIDDKVMVRDGPTHIWLLRLFAGVVNGKPTAWHESTTSWTAFGRAKARGSILDSLRCPWEECRLPTSEELAEHEEAVKNMLGR